MDFSPYAPKELPHWGGVTPQQGIASAQNQVMGAVDAAGNQVRDGVGHLNKKFMDVLPYLAVGGTVLSALWGQDNDELWGKQAEANDAADAGIKAQPLSER